jgi:hypothetical protein
MASRIGLDNARRRAEVHDLESYRNAKVRSQMQPIWSPVNAFFVPKIAERLEKISVGNNPPLVLRQGDLFQKGIRLSARIRSVTAVDLRLF